MNFAPLTLAAVGFAVIYGCWRNAHSKLISPRIPAVVGAAAAFFLAFGLPSLLYAFAGSATSDTGTTVLLVADVVLGFVFLFEALLAHRFHPVGTPLLCGLFGFCVAITWAAWPQIGHYISALPHKTARAMGKEAHHIRTMHPATGTAGHQQHTYLVAFVLVVLAVAFLARRANRKRAATAQAPAVPQPAFQGGLGIGRFFSGLRGRRGGRGAFGTTERRASVDSGQRGGALPIGRS